VLGKKKADQPVTRETSPDAADTAVGGKGRATPSRKDAEAARRARRKPAMSGREARKRDRAARQAEQARAMEAMKTGDERYFPARDAGPVRALVRDIVDSRRLLTEFFLPVLMVILVFSFIPATAAIATLVWIVTMALIIGEMTWLGLKIRREVRDNFPGESTGRHIFYGLTRATMLRRFRLPRPRLGPGDSY
jgi:hypothetical protein